MHKRVINTLLVGSRRIYEEDEPEQAEVLYLLDANRAAMREAFFQSEELSAEVYSLRREVIRLSKLVEVRERERESVKQAHKKRLTEVRRLERYNEKLENWLGSEEELFLENGPEAPKQKKKKKKKNKNKKKDKKNKGSKERINSFAIAASPVDDSE